MIQDGGMIPCDAETIDVPVENQGAMIEDVVNVPNLFSESGTSDDNVMSLDDDQRSIPKVGNDHNEYSVTDLAGVRPRRRPHLWCEVNHCACNERLTNGRRPRLWRDMDHAVWTERQTTCLMSIVEESHANLLFCRLAGVADGRPMFAEPQHDSWSSLWCPPEWCGNRLLVWKGEKSEPKIVSFGQSAERLSTVSGTTNGDYDDLEWSTETMDGIPANQPKPLPHGDRRPEIGDGMEWTDPWSIIHSIKCHSVIQSMKSIPDNMCYKGRRRDGKRDPPEDYLRS